MRTLIAIAMMLAAMPLQAAPAQAPMRSPMRAPTDEQRTAAHLERIADSPPRLRMFLQAMPKGGDLHNHAGGAIYAEDFLRWAAAAGQCLTLNDYRVVDPPCDRPDRMAATDLARDYPHYSRAIDAFSTRGFETGIGDPVIAGYDRFFSTFARFGPSGRDRGGEALALVRRQAAADRVSYVELSTGSVAARPVVARAAGADGTDFDALWQRVAPALPAAVAAARAEADRDEAEAARLDGCAGPTPAPACAVTLRYLYTALRIAPPEQVFAQLALGFALAAADPRFAGINIAAPEHDPVAIRDYALHMRMMAWLKARYLAVPLSLHAGELTLGLVPPRDLAFHVHDAVAVAGARRIGHGVDLPYERDPHGLLARMARDRVAVEINLTSNAVILGVKGAAHPLSVYRQAGVPVVLSTDDEGVSRSDMTNEYVRAVTEQRLHYADLKQMARDSLQYAFLPGASLWQDRAGGPLSPPCRSPGSDSCSAFVAANPRARIQQQLELDFARFERDAATPRF